MKNVVRIGIDYHGVITANPDFFRAFCALAIADGAEIYILSGGFTKDIKAFLDAHNIAYSHIWSMADYFDNKKQLTRLNDGTFQVDDKAWNKAKAEYCLENKIDFHIDDSAVYGKYFATPFCLYDAKNHTCANNQLIVDFRQSPVLALNSILNFVQQQKA